MHPTVATSFTSKCLVVGLLVTGVARAEPARAGSVQGHEPRAALAAAPAPPATRRTSAAARDAQAELEAEALLERAKADFQRGLYRQALPLLERALQLTDTPRNLFNLGVLHHKLSECAPARDYFQRYLERDPQGAARQQTLHALQELHEHCPRPATGGDAPGSPAAAAVAAGPAPPPPPAVARPVLDPGPAPAPDVDRDGSPPAHALALMGLGVAAGIGAGVSIALQRQAQNDIDELGARAAQDQASWDDFESQRESASSDARLYRGLSLGLGAACAVLVGAGVTVWVIDASQPRSSHGASMGLGVGYAGRF